MEDKKPDSVWDYLQSYTSYAILLGFMLIFLYTNIDFFFYIWRFFRTIEFFFLTGLQAVIGVFGFQGEAKKGLMFLINVPHEQLTLSSIGSFESHFNEHLRFFYAAIVFVVAYKMFRNQRKVTFKPELDDLIGIYKQQSEALYQLVDDNPHDHSFLFDFKNRSDHHNRHAQSLSPSKLLTCNPIYLATQEEMKQFRRNPESSRPMCIINNQKNTFDFSQALAVKSLKRQITGIPVKKPYYSRADDAPRLFDKEGKLIPLQLNKKKHAVANFRENKLLNNGRKYMGDDQSIHLLFDKHERWVFEFLKNRYRNPDVDFYTTARLLLEHHAYSRTYLVELLAVCRLNETIASSEFWILKQRDRVLYYSLLSSGEEMPFYEALGVMAHHSMEKATKHGESDIYVNSACMVLRQDAKRISSWTPPDKNVIDRQMHGVIEDESVKERMEAVLEFDFDLLNKQQESAVVT